MSTPCLRRTLHPSSVPSPRLIECWILWRLNSREYLRDKAKNSNGTFVHLSNFRSENGHQNTHTQRHSRGVSGVSVSSGWMTQVHIAVKCSFDTVFPGATATGCHRWNDKGATNRLLRYSKQYFVELNRCWLIPCPCSPVQMSRRSRSRLTVYLTRSRLYNTRLLKEKYWSAGSKPSVPPK